MTRGRPDFWARLKSSRGRPSFWAKWHRRAVLVEPWGILLVAFMLVLSVAQFWFEYHDRVDERVVRAWGLVTTTAPGNSGKREALEYLNKEDGLCFEWPWKGCAIVLKSRAEFIGIDLSETTHKGQVFLDGVDLSEANLSNAHLSGADLSRASLSEAILSNAHLSGAFLYGADLSRAYALSAHLSGAFLYGADLSLANFSVADFSSADLSLANLSSAGLSGANFSAANLSLANLSRANLSGARELSQEQLDTACAEPNAPPLVPRSLIWNERPCPG